MPELPDVELYREALAVRVVDRPLERVRLASPFLLRTVKPPLRAVEGRLVVSVARLGKRLVLELEDELFLVLHLMVAGRLRWRDPGASVPRRLGLAAFDFPPGTLLLTEAGSKKRASLHVVEGRSGLAPLHRGGLEPLGSTPGEFAAALRAENRTLKRALTDPRILSGIGNAYSDEILHRSRLSPVQLTSRLDDEALGRLHAACTAVLEDWSARLREEVGEGWPEKVTAFREDFAVHGRHGKPCPDCGSKVQRIVHAENETNYCARCQTGGKLLRDRALSKLLRKDWPRTIDELDQPPGQA